MKKKILALFAVVAIATLCLTSCGLKSCYCCEMVGDVVQQSDTYTDIDRSCESLNTNTLKCMEEGSQLPCSSIAFDMKK